MSYTALYRKYRPSNFSNVVGQNVVVKVLINSLLSNHISHAYLFSGPRGTGKTSIAKIFAKAVNCLNFNGDICGKCFNCLGLENNDIDIIEIDAASNNGVEEIRTIRENAKLLPSFCKYKVYIIDEVHMLSTGAFNALLKTLEEPPSHVIFILATTEINKIPLTILSRCQRFDFTRLSDDDIVARLNYILESEGRILDENVVKYIAEESDGGLRDAINLLDQILSLEQENISINDIDNISGRISLDLVHNLLKFILNIDYVSTLNLISDISKSGKNFSDLVNKMLILLRDIAINNEVSNYFDSDYINLLNTYSLNNNQIMILTKKFNELLSDLKNSLDQKMLVEIYLLYIINSLTESDENINDNIVINNSIIKENLNSQLKEKNINSSKTSTGLDEISIEKDFNNNLKHIRINNVLAEASKSQLNKLNVEFDNLNDYVSNKKYNIVAVLLLESKIVVASDKYILFSFDDKANVDIFYENLKLIELLLIEVFHNSFKAIAVSNSEWLSIRNEYVIKKKNGESYVFIEENDVKLDLKENNKDAQDFAMNIFGEDAVSVI